MTLDQNVVRFDITMHNTPGMSEVERLCRLPHQVQPEVERPRRPIAGATVEQRAQRTLRQVLHGDVVPPLLFIEAEDAHNVRMLKRGNRLRLLAKTRLKTGIARKMRVHDLERLQAIKMDMTRAVHLPHAARAKQRLNATVADNLS